jgi:hypothetical protein
MFEISADHIAALNDADLRALVALLCEAELRKKGLPTSSVTWGGHQDATDGGVDVRVDLPARTAITGFVPLPQVGYQVKNQDMPRSEILREMRPQGALRPSIKDLADKSGAYIIVSSQGSIADPALKARRKAMQGAVSGMSNTSHLLLDFYDRNRIATWVRDHFALIPWVRRKAGRAIPGWHSYGPWAYPAGGVNDKYLADDGTRFQTGKKEDANGLSLTEGIARLRALLRKPRNVVRLVGMSGVGKTRLVQALFDARIGNHPLDPSTAIYTNMAGTPEPQPPDIASDLVNAGMRNIMVVDNCPQDVHRRLSEVCRSSESQLSVITIEYDIREDEPEGTEVFKLEAASPDLIEEILKVRFPSLSRVDVRKIAEFSSGNARIAIALAARLGKSETVAGLSDDELFTRLFQQRHGHDASLLATARACSLVYSFNGEQLSGIDAELPRLGALIGKTAQDVFGSIAELRRRHLVQQRGQWRAILPHAIANRLAFAALQNIPMTILQGELIDGAPQRLLKSFSRRLGYLHNSPEAVEIAKTWLQPGGLLGDVLTYNELCRSMLINIAPAAPEAALSALERALNERSDNQPAKALVPFVLLLHSLAYDPKLFERAVAIIAFVAGAQDEQKPQDEAADAFASLFFLYFSGTHAPLEQRLQFVERLLQSHRPKDQGLAFRALRGALKTNHFSTASMFDFGARSRDYGYWPRTHHEARNWFAAVLKMIERFLNSTQPIVDGLLEILAEQFRGLWNAGMHDELERLCRIIVEKEHWSDGWIAVRETLQYDHKDLVSDVATKLRALDRLLQPQNLIQRVRSVVLASGSGLLELGALDSDNSDPTAVYERGELIAYELGKEAAVDEGALNELLPELVMNRERERLWSFGGGLAAGTPRPMQLWEALIGDFSSTPENQRSTVVLGGFLQRLNDIDEQLTSSLLEGAVEHATMTYYFPVLQAAVRADAAAVRRLHRAVVLNKAPIYRFRGLSGGRWADPLSGQELGSLLLSVAKRDGGFDVAIDILAMRLFSDTAQKRGHSPDLILIGRQLLKLIPIEGNHKSHNPHHRLGDIFRACLSGSDGLHTAQAICERLKKALVDGKTYAFYHGDLLRALLRVHPIAVFNTFLNGDEADRQLGVQTMRNIDFAHKKSAITDVPENEVLAWCNQKPAIRFSLMAALVDVFYHDKTGTAEWSPIATRLFKEAPKPSKVLEQFINRIVPESWSGSRTAIIEARIELIKQLETHPDPGVSNYALREHRRLAQTVEEEKQAERTRCNIGDQRFEW